MNLREKMQLTTWKDVIEIHCLLQVYGDFVMSCVISIKEYEYVPVILHQQSKILPIAEKLELVMATYKL